MRKQSACPKCDGAMREGFLVDNGYGAIHVGTWQEGAPERRIMTGYKQTPKTQSKIKLFACDHCGFVESFLARNPTAGEAPADMWPLARATLLTGSLVSLVTIGILVARIAGVADVPPILPIILLFLSVSLLVTGLAARSRNKDG
jgi:hypothetical protein